MIFGHIQCVAIVVLFLQSLSPNQRAAKCTALTAVLLEVYPTSIRGSGYTRAPLEVDAQLALPCFRSVVRRQTPWEVDAILTSDHTLHQGQRGKSDVRSGCQLGVE